MRGITALLLSAGMLVPLASGQNITLVGQGYCRDASVEYYSYTRYASIDTPDLETCRISCIAENTTVGSLAMGLTFDTTSPTPAEPCSCLYRPGQLDSLSTSDFPIPQPQRVVPQLGTGSIMDGDGTSMVNCYKFDIKCDARMLIALDRTFANNVKASVKLGSDVGTAVISKMNFGPNTAVGLLNLKSHSVSWGIPFSSPISTDQSSLLTALPRLASGGWKNRATNFWKLFQGEADVVSDPNIPSYIMIISDGNLLNDRNWVRLGQWKAKMKSRLGAKMPKIICYRVRIRYWSRFFRAVCDDNLFFYKGMDSKSDDLIAQSIADSMCYAP